MLFTGKDILSRFKEHLERATRVRIATAWATQGKALNGLEAVDQKNKRLKVCALVGTHGNVTDPAALERLKKLGKLRLAKDASLFHPKIYVFESENGASCAWVGSANFTGRGFGGGNVEIMYETDDVEPFLKWFKQQWRQSERATKEAIDDYRKRREKDPPSRTLPEVGESEGAAPGPSLPPFARTGKWKPVRRRKEIRSAFDQMRATLIDEADKLDRAVGYLNTVYWRADPGYWCAFGQRDQGYWIPFGPENPPQRSDRLGNGWLQINPPFDGNNEDAWRYRGLFVRNRGDIFLARDLKGIRKGRGRVNPKKLRKELKKRLPGSVVDVRWGDRTRCVVILGEVGSGELRYRVAELVRLVAELKGAGTGAGEAP